MKTETQRILHSSKESNWRTPPEMFAALDREFKFDLDAAADEASGLCQNWIGESEDGLVVSWGTLGEYVFLNPPYSREAGLPIELWIEKCWREAQAGCTVVAVLPHSVQTIWYQRWVYGVTKIGQWSGFAADEVRQIPHRVTFLHPDGTPRHNAPGNTCVVIWRPNPGYVGPWSPTVRYWSYR